MAPWLESPAGRYLLAWEQRQLDAQVADIFGYSALQLGLPEARLPLAEACIFLATAPKSNSGVLAIDAAIADVRAGKGKGFPRELQNVHADSTEMMREQNYKYPHNYPGHWVAQQYLPDDLVGAMYYEYGESKIEQAARAYWEQIKK